ncbi:hypothetical protein ACRQ5B_04065 [Pseudarthrobacter sp. L19]|uniref:hypothetical protein n=1 Tax=Pseudarthrobacter sp. L19 TaxID=3423951 RepID=UPI003D7A9619
MPARRSLWRAVLAFIAAGTVCGVLVAGLFIPATAMAGAVVSDSIGMFDKLPDDLNLNAPPATSTVLANDGSVIASFYAENRAPVSLDKMSPSSRTASSPSRTPVSTSTAASTPPASCVPSSPPRRAAARARPPSPSSTSTT